MLSFRLFRSRNNCDVVGQVEVGAMTSPMTLPPAFGRVRNYIIQPDRVRGIILVCYRMIDRDIVLVVTVCHLSIGHIIRMHRAVSPQIESQISARDYISDTSRVSR